MIIEKSSSLLGMKPLPLQKFTREIFFFSTAFDFFTVEAFKFSNENLFKIFSKMTKGDHANFSCFFPGSNEIESYFRDTINGIRKYKLGENDRDLIEARKKLKLFYAVDFILGFVGFAFAFYFISLVIF